MPTKMQGHGERRTPSVQTGPGKDNSRDTNVGNHITMQLLSGTTDEAGHPILCRPMLLLVIRNTTMHRGTVTRRY